MPLLRSTWWPTYWTEKREDIPNPAIFTEWRLDQGAEMEQGAKFCSIPR